MSTSSKPCAANMTIGWSSPSVTRPARAACGWFGSTFARAESGQARRWPTGRMGALAFLAAGHTPDQGLYGAVPRKALDYLLRHAQPSGLLNVADPQRDMYNHGLATFVLGQAHGMVDDPRLTGVLDRALKLIAA